MRRAALLLIAPLVFAGSAFAAGDPHQHAAPGGAKLVLDHGKKWQTDAPLRLGMERIRGALAADLKAIHAGKQTRQNYAALAAKVNGEVATIVQTCKLDPQADAQLHLVVADLLGAAEAMEGKAKGVTRRAGAERLAQALNTYGEFFEHPGWKSVR